MWLHVLQPCNEDIIQLLYILSGKHSAALAQKPPSPSAELSLRPLRPPLLHLLTDEQRTAASRGGQTKGTKPCQGSVAGGKAQEERAQGEKRRSRRTNGRMSEDVRSEEDKGQLSTGGLGVTNARNSNWHFTLVTVMTWLFTVHVLLQYYAYTYIVIIHYTVHYSCYYSLCLVWMYSSAAVFIHSTSLMKLVFFMSNFFMSNLILKNIWLQITWILYLKLHSPLVYMNFELNWYEI